jgi:hypothetical protein
MKDGGAKTPPFFLRAIASLSPAMTGKDRGANKIVWCGFLQT